jgi:hypothetical protein
MPRPDGGAPVVAGLRRAARRRVWRSGHDRGTPHSPPCRPATTAVPVQGLSAGGVVWTSSGSGLRRPRGIAAGGGRAARPGGAWRVGRVRKPRGSVCTIAARRTSPRRAGRRRGSADVDEPVRREIHLLELVRVEHAHMALAGPGEVSPHGVLGGCRVTCGDRLDDCRVLTGGGAGVGGREVQTVQVKV